jgi:hypothetical protein
MRLLRMRRYALATCAAAALMAGCGVRPFDSAQGNMPAGGAGAALPAASRAHSNLAHFAHAGSWFRHDSSRGGDLVYMTQGGNVGIYAFSGKQVGELKGFEFAQLYGLCSDTAGDVWVTWGESLLEYSRGGTIPIAQLYTNGTAAACAVDPTTGDIAVADGPGEELGSEIDVYTNIYEPGQTYKDPDMNVYLYCTYDGQGNLFANGARNLKKGSVLAELPQGGSTMQTVKMDEKFERAGGLQWDGQYVAIGDSLKHVVYEMSVAGGLATTVSTSHFHDWSGMHFKTIEPFAIGNGEIVLTFSERQTGFWKFPGGGNTLRRISVVTGAKTISVAPSGSRKGGK